MFYSYETYIHLDFFVGFMALLKEKLKLEHSIENPNGFSAHCFYFYSVQLKDSGGGKQSFLTPFTIYL